MIKLEKFSEERKKELQLQESFDSFYKYKLVKNSPKKRYHENFKKWD